VGFDGSTTMDEFTLTLTSLIGCRPPDQSGFAIFSDDPIDSGVDHSLAGSDKVWYLYRIKRFGLFLRNWKIAKYVA
jgi:hypothetical protein